MTTQPEAPARPAIRIGTRGSPLALAQTEEVRRRLVAAHEGLVCGDIEVVIIRTTGDRVQDRALAEVGGKALFSREIEDALLAGTIDIAVHSMKDMETRLRDGLTIPCLLPREDPRDAFVSAKAPRLAELPADSVVGTGSLRRAAQIRHGHPALNVAPLRGNVGTRLRKVEAGEVDATLLALAGLKRLGLADKATSILGEDEILPAVGQGAIGVECRLSDEAMANRLAPLNDEDTMTCVGAERGMLEVLGGSCRTPIAGLARIVAGRCIFRGLVASPDGGELHEAERRGSPAEAAALGREAGEELRARAGPAFFTEA